MEGVGEWGMGVGNYIRAAGMGAELKWVEGGDGLGVEENLEVRVGAWWMRMVD